VRLRLAQSRDAKEIRALLERTGRDPQDLQLARLTQLDPSRRVVVCATALIDSMETVAGLGAMDVGADEPDLLLVDEELTQGLDELLVEALQARAVALARPRAA
jgi:hypothetical protein